MAFLVTPAVVSIVQKDAKSLVIPMTEEEKGSNTANELEKNTKITHDYLVFSFIEFKEQKAIVYTYNQFAYSIYLDPASPPPKA
ncbi:hypothetical protein [Leeuwenhoekiella sp. NPDC079379]|uniref:hypothetical protein n=1 Tax=Leeuwenhoekiella sp. NPDC079379 TaxID=3364122 RepID=UPI0037CBC3EA